MGCVHLSEKSVKGRKEYSCEWCGEKINIGEVHSYRAYIMDDQMRTDRMHTECNAAMGEINWLERKEFEFGEFKRGTTISEND